MSAQQIEAARRYIEVGQPERALVTLAELDGEAAVTQQALQLRGYAHFARKDFQAAEDTARDALEADPQNVSMLFLLSLVLEQGGRLGEAERAILAALDL